MSLAGNWRFQQGDHPYLSSPALADSAWQLAAVPAAWPQLGAGATGIGWYHARITVADSLQLGSLGVLLEKVYVACEIYWDGKLVAQNGIVASSAREEIPGDDAFLCTLPTGQMAPSSHLLSLRVSNHHTLEGGMSLAPRIGRHSSLVDLQNFRKSLYGFFFGIFFISGLYHLALSFAGHLRREYLLFTVLSWCFAAFVFLDGLADLVDANPNAYVLRIQLTWITTLLLVAFAYWFVVTQFDYPHHWLRRVVLIATALFMLPLLYRESLYDMRLEWQLRDLWIQSSAFVGAYLAVWAVRHRKPGSLILAVGTLVLGIGAFLSVYLDSSLLAFGAFTVFAYAISLTLSSKMGALEDEIKRMLAIFRMFVPEQLLDRIAKQGLDSIRLGSASEESASILFSDIRSFSSIAENLTPAATLGFLNSFMQRMAPIIQANNGFVNQFIGDAIMAIFYAPTHSADAVDTAIAMRRTLEEFNHARQHRGESRIDIGIGINSGHVILGTIGSRTRMDSAVIGDAVNLGARIEQLTKRYRVGILITDRNYSRLPDPEKYCCREVDIVQVKGKTKVVTLYEIFDADPEPLKHKKFACLHDYHQGLLYYRAMEWEKAIAAFSRTLKILPNDPVAELYVERCILLQRRPPPLEWNGVTVLQTK